MRNTRSTGSTEVPRTGSSSRSVRSAVRLATLVAMVAVTLGLLMPRLTAGEPGSTSAPKVHLVAKGETLWSLAQRYSEGDPRRYVYEVQQLNGLRTSQVFPGQRLVLPPA